jgi:hypothetical protein
MVVTEPALLCDGNDMPSGDRDKKRAEFIRENI